MFEDKTFKRCACKGPLVDKDGRPVLDDNGQQKIGHLDRNCPRHKERSHGSWYYQIELERGGDGKRKRPREGGFATQADAAAKAEEVWRASKAGVNVLSDETVTEFLARWLKKKKTELKRTTAHEYERDIELYLVPHLGALKMRNLRARHAQGLFDWIVSDNERRVEHRAKVAELKARADAASAAWRAAPTGTKEEKAERARLRGLWTAARDNYLAGRKNLQRTTGPATMVSIRATLSSALSDAVKEELIAKNYATLLTLPKVTKPRALAWTPPRVARWKRTGEKPSPVMVWTLQQTAEFLDFIVDDRHFPAWHLVLFHGLRRGELAALAWDEVDLADEIIHISEQLVSISYEVHEDDPKADSVRDIKLNRDSAMLLQAWRKKQAAERQEWAEAGVPAKTGNRAFTKEDGTAYHPQFFTDRWDRLVELSGLPPIRLHDGRHEAASMALAAGVAPKAVQAMLGHASMRMTTDTYQTVLPEMHAATASASLDLITAYRKAEAAAQVALRHASVETTADTYKTALPEQAEKQAAKKAMRAKRQRRRVA
ncbi:MULTISPECIES: tyrosine-type recombinase/integrase [unclassified Streptomyces]|uniref:tyrosine-type recombinase/integrase n=1 Tax=unclassified Streptomyces TaxID=2593676 RepID=UPI002E81943B|nr:tyrosine-type recombinase/integrase [Streptomyces sp. NBC_00589]WTI37504.1 tyrosine-type recombinase/integrase [Streptomyces sp. NBC_00775]WUB28818.1 tyrosine-type recombinase/integrase [Streptomyces sp. NBC_00589]